MDTVKSPAAVLLSPEQAQLWERVNDITDPVATTPAELFLAASRRHATSPAVIAPRRSLSYRELAGMSADLLRRLRSDGGAADGVLICVEPGWEQAVAAIAALTGGLAWRVVDPAQPQTARWRALADTGARVVLTQSWLDDRLRWPEGTVRLALDELGGAGDEPLEPKADPVSVACVLDSAGGAELPVTHDGLATSTAQLAARFGVGPGDKVLAVCPLGDEVALSALLLALLSGAALVVPDDIDLRTPAAWVDLMRQHAVTVWHSPPALAALLAEHLHQRGDDRPERLRVALLGGEPAPQPVALWLRETIGPGLRIANLGPGGAGVLWSTCFEFDEPDPRRGHLPAGKPLSPARAYVLSETLTPCPAWVNGRLHLTGRAAAGTAPAERVVTLAGGQSAHRTGYTARLLPSGDLDLVGEDATRIEVSGHPLNLREVEAALSTHPDVLFAAVVPATDGSVAFVKTSPGVQVTGSALLDHLRKKMSPYLLPQRVELVGALPLTPAGRVDRAALAARLAPADSGPAGSAGPQDRQTGDALTRRACELAARVLGLSDVEPDMNLLDVGATSVQLVRMAVQAEAELGIEVDVEELLRFPSVSVLVSFAQQGLDAREPDGVEVEVSPEGLILDPVRRAAFKDGRPALRKDLAPASRVGLDDGHATLEAMASRRTTRRFAPGRVGRADFADLLGNLRRLDTATGQSIVDLSGTPKFAYPSAGSLYPVQTYVTLAEDRVEGLEGGGAYYYDPDAHELVLLDGQARIEAADHAWINREAFRQSAFCLYLVADLAAIEPMYGGRARDYCLLEAGAMVQLLMSAAAGSGLGLCPVGEMDDARLRELLRLGERRTLVHCLLGGPPDAASRQDQETETRMLRRLRLIGDLGLPEAGEQT